MLLIYTPKITSRITYVFKHICIRVLGLDIGFTSKIETFIAHQGPKLSYGIQPLGNEFFVQANQLLFQQGVESIDITVRDWEETKCFFVCGEKSALPFDIFAASFYLISRYEEYLPHVKDELGRYPVTESLGYKERFLKQPVVDIWAHKFKKALVTYFPDITFAERTLTTHHFVEVETPYKYLRKGVFRSLVCFISDIIKFRFKTFFQRMQVVFGFKKDPYDVYDWLINLVKKGHSKLTVFFILGETPEFITSINTEKPKYLELIKHVADYMQTGLLFSPLALTNFNLLKEEKNRMETITNKPIMQSLNYNYLVNLPEIYRNLIALEIPSDCSMVYETQPGFRAGTCTPFLFYDLDYEIKTPLLIHPMAFSSKAMPATLSMSQKEALVKDLYHKVSEVNGTFSILFNTINIAENSESDFWKKIITSF